MDLRNDIETYPGFCSKCGSILPSLSMEEFIKCYSCKTVFGPESKLTNVIFLILIIINLFYLLFYLKRVKIKNVH